VLVVAHDTAIRPRFASFLKWRMKEGSIGVVSERCPQSNGRLNYLV
jgi:hypothetical protein